MNTKFGLVNHRLLFTIFIWVIVDEVRTFNVDVRKPIYFQEEENAMFGYTVAFIANRSGTTSLLVGAPNRTGVDGTKGFGGFYECEINSSSQRGSCRSQEIVDYTCQKFQTRYKCEDYQMLGATIAVNHKYQDVKFNMNVPRVSVCAPGWKYTLIEKYGKNVTLPVGKCYHFKETWQQEECESDNKYCIPFWKKPDEYFLPDGTDDFALAQGGFTMKYSQDGRYSFIGAPGVRVGRGAVKIHQISREHIFDKRKDGMWVQYFGFSLTTADFKEYGSFTAGIPNYHSDQRGFTGKVEVFSMADFTMKNALNFGETESCDGDITVIPNDQPQSGSKFGYIVEGINVDNQGMDELFVGAPLYSDFVKKRVVAPETGRVFVYRVTTEKICGPIVVLTGAASDASLRKLAAYARFGTAISSAGDLNHDGYKDVAIGAPYEDEYTGAVYIYNGGTDGVKDVFSQRITGRVIGSNIPGLNIQTFGWHINGEYDVDKNGFTDLAIGAYKNDVAIVLRTRPLVNVIMDILLSPSIIPLNGTPGSACGDVPCLRLRVCFNYMDENSAPVGVAEKLNLQYDVELDMLAKDKNDSVRIEFQNDSNAGRKNITLVRSVDLQHGECRSSTIVVKKNGDAYVPNDLRTPVRFAISFTLLPTLQYYIDFYVLDPVLKPEVQSTKIVEANFDIICENKSSCLSDLELAVDVRCMQSSDWTLVDENTTVVVGDARELELTAKVTNRLDSAFRVDLVVQVQASLKSTDSKHGVIGALCQDNQAPGLTHSKVTCTANDKLDAKQYIQIVFKYAVTEKYLLPSVQDILVVQMPKEITIFAQANQANADVNQTNNIFNITIPVKLEAAVEIIESKSMSEQVKYKNDPQSDRSLYILHRYHLINNGPSPLINSIINITVPIGSNDKTLAVIVTCANYQCCLVTCNVGTVKGKEKKTVDVNINIVEKNIPSDKSLREITYVSRAVVSDPYVTFTMPDKLFAAKRTRLVMSPISISPYNIWIIIGSVAGGIVLLTIVIIILWKCGFFNRKQHNEIQNYKKKVLYKASAGAMPSPLTSDTDRFMCIAYLLVDVGSRVLRQLLNHHTVTSTCTLGQYLAKNMNIINSLRRVFNQTQMDIMFPPNGGDTKLDDYDITLLSALFQNIVPTLNQQEKDMIKRLREERNKLYGHAKSCQISANDFQTYWIDISSTLTTLSQQCGDTAFEAKILQEIQRTKVSAIPAGSYLDILKTWFDMIESVKDELQNVKARLQVLESNKKSSASES